MQHLNLLLFKFSLIFNWFSDREYRIVVQPVRSVQGIQFRQWATKTLQEYLAKGFVMDDEQLKNPESSVYFDELLNRIRDIRSSEKVFWRKVCDIYATSIDYDGKAQSSMQLQHVATLKAASQKTSAGTRRPSTFSLALAVISSLVSCIIST